MLAHEEVPYIYVQRHPLTEKQRQRVEAIAARGESVHAPNRRRLRAGGAGVFAYSAFRHALIALHPL